MPARNIAAMFSLLSLLTRKRRITLASLMLVAGLFQALLPLFMRPSLAQASDGSSVVVCTLQGLQPLEINGEPAAHQGTANICPVCLLSHANAAPLISSPTVTPVYASTLIARITLEQDHHPVIQPHFPRALTRAPPLV